MTQLRRRATHQFNLIPAGGARLARRFIAPLQRGKTISTHLQRRRGIACIIWMIVVLAVWRSFIALHLDPGTLSLSDEKRSNQDSSSKSLDEGGAKIYIILALVVAAHIAMIMRHGVTNNATIAQKCNISVVFSLMCGGVAMHGYGLKVKYDYEDTWLEYSKSILGAAVEGAFVLTFMAWSLASLVGTGRRKMLLVLGIPLQFMISFFSISAILGDATFRSMSGNAGPNKELIIAGFGNSRQHVSAQFSSDPFGSSCRLAFALISFLGSVGIYSRHGTFEKDRYHLPKPNFAIVYMLALCSCSLNMMGYYSPVTFAASACLSFATSLRDDYVINTSNDESRTRRAGRINTSGPNVIYIQHESLSGSIMMNTKAGRESMPFFQSIKENDPDMYVFKNMRSVSGNTVDALPALLTGCLPYDERGMRHIYHDCPPVAHDFYDNGYATATFSSRALDYTVRKGQWKDLYDLIASGFDKVVDPLSEKFSLDNAEGCDDRKMVEPFHKWLMSLDNAKLFQGFDETDNWAPIRGDAKDWVSLDIKNPCLRYSELNPGSPKKSQDKMSHILCCKEFDNDFGENKTARSNDLLQNAIQAHFEKYQPQWFHIHGDTDSLGRTHDEAALICSKNDMSLCTYEGYCMAAPDGLSKSLFPPEKFHRDPNERQRQSFYAQFYNFNQHYPYIEDENIHGNRYFSSLRSLDMFLEGIFQVLNNTQRLENTIVIGAGDHGEDSFKGRYVRMSALNSNVLQSAAYIYWPKKLMKDAEAKTLRHNTEQLSYSLDILPTIRSVITGSQGYLDRARHSYITGVDLTSTLVGDDRVTIAQNLQSSVNDVQIGKKPIRLWALSTKEKALYHRFSHSPQHALEQGKDSLYVLLFGNCTADIFDFCMKELDEADKRYFAAALRSLKTSHFLGEGAKASELVNFFLRKLHPDRLNNGSAQAINQEYEKFHHKVRKEQVLGNAASTNCTDEIAKDTRRNICNAGNGIEDDNNELARIIKQNCSEILSKGYPCHMVMKQHVCGFDQLLKHFCPKSCKFCEQESEA